MNANIGHGHVFPRPDGMKARCGGPGLCRQCSADLARKNGESNTGCNPALCINGKCRATGECVDVPATIKPSNPKDAFGIKKVPVSPIPAPVIGEVGLAMLEGALKYGRHNYRAIGVRASVYYDAVMSRHMPAWWEGQDIDPDSGVSHITKAIASLIVLRDAMMRGNWTDDRPPRSADGWIDELNSRAAALLEKYSDSVAAYTEKSHPSSS